MRLPAETADLDNVKVSFYCTSVSKLCIHEQALHTLQQAHLNVCSSACSTAAALPLPHQAECKPLQQSHSATIRCLISAQSPAQAKFEGGVLKIDIPKKDLKEDEKRNKINVE